jgi:hypothetical protein
VKLLNWKDVEKLRDKPLIFFQFGVSFNQITMQKFILYQWLSPFSFFRVKKEDTTVIKKSSGKINIARLLMINCGMVK